MHRTRRQAKYAAWYDDPNDEPSIIPIKNPFGKYRPPNNSRSSTRDVERGPLTHVQTNPDTQDVVQRQQDLVGRHPKHAATTPLSSSNPNTRPIAEDVPMETTASPTNSIHNVPITGEKISEERSSDTITNGNSPQLEKDGSSLRQRDNKTDKKSKFFGLLSHKKLDENEESSSDDNNGKTKKKFTVMSQIRSTLFNSWVNVLLICSPVGIALHFAGVKPVAIFVVNFIAIIPLAGMLSFATEEIALRTGEVIGGLLNASFGNAVELIVSIIALVKGQILIVQTSLIGSMLSNLLLVLGMCFFFGGINRVEQAFNMTVAQTASSLLFLAVSAIVVPTVFDIYAPTLNADDTSTRVASLSRGTSILLLLVYACYLFFQLKSHNKMFLEPSQKNQKRDIKGRVKNVLPSRFRSRADEPVSNEEQAASLEAEPQVEEQEEPSLSIWVAIGTLAASTVLVALNAEFLVDSINEITCDGPISKTFVGLILLPIVGNAAEHATAVTVAVKDKMDLSIGVAVGSSMQIALLVLPLTVILGWIIGEDGMTLYFDGFQMAVLFVSVLLVNYLIQDGKSHWLEGVLLMMLYIIIAIAAFEYPTSGAASGCE